MVRLSTVFLAKRLTDFVIIRSIFLLVCPLYACIELDIILFITCTKLFIFPLIITESFTNVVIFNSIKELEKGIARKIMSETSHDEMYSKPSIAQMQIIKYILKHDGKTIYQRDLEEVFNLRRATISGILKTMEKNNVIIRVCDPNDARGKIVILSDDAKKFFKEKETLFKKIETVLKKDISKEELEIFYKVILKMRDNINRKD